MRQSCVRTPRAHWGQVAITVLAILAILGAVVLSVIGASNANPNAVGIKTIDDYIPAIVLTLGSCWWLIILLVSASRGRTTRAERHEESTVRGKQHA
jgi:TRAP-type C4-dicarboxylate transport system permease small subunit